MLSKMTKQVQTWFLSLYCFVHFLLRVSEVLDCFMLPERGTTNIKSFFVYSCAKMPTIGGRASNVGASSVRACASLCELIAGEA